MPPSQPLLRPTTGGRDRQRYDRVLLLGLLPCLALALAIAFVVHPYLPATPDRDPTVPRIFAGVIGMIAGLGQQRLVSWLLGKGRGPLSRHALLARARSDAPPADDQLIVATGVVQCERPLTSPIGGVPCAAYHYRMYSRERIYLTNGRDIPVYWGYASQPFSIAAATRRYPIPDAPLLGDKATPLEGEAVYVRARNYFRSTNWQTVEYPALEVTDVDFLNATDHSTAGARRDFALDNTVAPDVAVLRYEEKVLPIGATVSAIGHWSAARGALVRPPESAVGLLTIVTGGPEGLDGKPDMPEVDPQPITSSIIAIVAAVGTFYFARLVLPHVKP